MPRVIPQAIFVFHRFRNILNMSHTEDFHVKNVQKLCRICLKLAFTQKKKKIKKEYLCKEDELKLYKVHGIDVDNEVHGKHSTNLLFV